MKNRTKHMKSFLVQRPNGKTEIVDMYQNFIDTSTFDGPSEAAGMKSLRLRNSGQAVNRIDENTFEDIFPKERLRTHSKYPFSSAPLLKAIL